MEHLFFIHSGWGKALHVPERVQLFRVVEGPLPVMVKRRYCGWLALQPPPLLLQLPPPLLLV